MILLTISHFFGNLVTQMKLISQILGFERIYLLGDNMGLRLFPWNA